MPQTSEQAGQVFAQMTPEQVRQYLTQKMVNIGPLQPVDAPMGSADGVRREDMTPTYGNANVQGLQADGQGGYWGPVTPPFDTQQAGGKYGQYFAKFDVQGNMQPDSLQFSPVERDSGWLSNHLPEVVGTILVAAGGLAAAEIAGVGGGAGNAAGLASADTGMLGFGGTAGGAVATTTAATAAAPIVAAGAPTLGAGATVADIAAAITSGADISQLPAAALNLLRSGGLTALNALRSLLPSDKQGVVGQIANSLGLGGGDTLSGLLTAGGGLAALGSLKNASNTAADQYGALGDSLKGQYQFLGDKAQGLFSDLGATGRQGYENLGMKVGETYNGLADTYQKGYGLLGDQVGNTYNNLATQTEGQYRGLADRTKAEVGKFTPYNITTNVGSTNDKGAFTASPGMQGVSDSATKAAQSSFDAGNAIDVNNLAGQRYDLMQSIFAPGDNAALAELRANQQARGRSGIQSLNMANSTGAVGANPSEVAYYKALGDRNLKAQATAADQALAQRGGLLTQGAGAAATPLNIGAQGLQQIQTGVQAGNTAFQNNMAGTQLGAGIERSGLDAGTQARMTGAGATTNLYRQGLDTGLNTRLRGADQVTGLFSQGLGYDLAQQGQGINRNIDLSTQGIQASTPQYVQQIAQKYQGNLAATNALFGLLGQLARASGKAAPANTGNAQDALSQLGSILKGAGLTDQQANQQIQQIVQSQVDMSDPFMTNNYGDNVDTINSIWG